MPKQLEFIAEADVYLDKAGNVVGAKDPAKMTKLVSAGGRLSAEEAARYGLAGADAQSANEAPEKTIAAPIEDAPKPKAGKKTDKP